MLRTVHFIEKTQNNYTDLAINSTGISLGDYTIPGSAFLLESSVLVCVTWGAAWPDEYHATPHPCPIHP